MNRLMVSRRFGGHGHGHSNEPHAPEFHTKLGKAFLVATYFWIFYRMKEDKGQLFGLYYPWLDEHEHEHTPTYQSEDHHLPDVAVHHHDNHEHEAEEHSEV